MGHDLPGKVIGLLLAFVLTAVMPFVTVTVSDEMNDRRLIISDVCGFIDTVVDSRQIDDAMLRDLNLNLASYGVTVDYEIKRYARSVNPDPITNDSYYVTYVQMDDNKNFNKGDKISVHLYTVGYSSTSALARKLTGMFVGDLDKTITARIR